MERNSSPLSNTESLDASSPPSSPSPSDVPGEGEIRKKKASRKKRKNTGEDGGDQEPVRKHKKPKQRRKQVSKESSIPFYCRFWSFAVAGMTTLSRTSRIVGATFSRDVLLWHCFVSMICHSLLQ